LVYVHFFMFLTSASQLRIIARYAG